MVINIKYILLGRINILWFFSLLIFLGVLVSCSLRGTHVHPEGTWDYPGGGASPMSMVFHPGGRLTFDGGFDNFQPATCNFDEQTRKLQIKVSNYDKSHAECSNLYSEEYSCLRYNPKTETFKCILTSNTKSLTFLGWNFFRR